MRKLMMFMLLCTATCAQTSNGRDWIGFNTTACGALDKYAYLQAVVDTASYFASALEPADKHLKNPLEMLDSKGATYSEIAGMIDKFYADAANMRIPIIYAIAIANLRVKGEPASAIAEYTESLRKEYAR